MCIKTTYEFANCQSKVSKHIYISYVPCKTAFENRQFCFEFLTSIEEKNNIRRIGKRSCVYVECSEDPIFRVIDMKGPGKMYSFNLCDGASFESIYISTIE